MRNAHLLSNRKAPSLQLLQHVVMRSKTWPTLGCSCHLAHTIGKERQRPLHGNAGIQLAHRARSGIARVGKQLAASSFLPGIELGEICTAHIDLATHFQHSRHIGCRQHQGNLANGANVVGDILTHFTVATSDCVHKTAIFVAQAHGQAIELGFSHVLNKRGTVTKLQLATNARIKCLCTCCLVVSFSTNGKHRHHMAHRLETIQHRTNHALSGGVRCKQCGVSTFQSL